jgi:hypothetical protein
VGCGGAAGRLWRAGKLTDDDTDSGKVDGAADVRTRRRQSSRKLLGRYGARLDENKREEDREVKRQRRGSEWSATSPRSVSRVIADASSGSVPSLAEEETNRASP